jgi:MerR family transcriptional regulator, light-induced transcriptional regulator
VVKHPTSAEGSGLSRPPAPERAAARIFEAREAFSIAALQSLGQGSSDLHENLRAERISRLSDSLAALSEALLSHRPAFFLDHLHRGLSAEIHRGSNGRATADALGAVLKVLAGKLSHEEFAAVEPLVHQGEAALQAKPSVAEPGLLADGPLSSLARSYLDALLAGDWRRAGSLVTQAFEEGVPIRSIYLDVLQASQREIGRLWEMNEVSVAQEHLCTAATQLIMAQFYPRLFMGDTPRRGLIILAAAGGELHELGIRMVADFFELDGWDTRYLGANLPADALVDMLVAQRPAFLAISASGAARVPAIREAIERVRSRPELAHTKILVGGSPFCQDPELWRNVGADGFGRDAAEAVAVAERLARGIEG